MAPTGWKFWCRNPDSNRGPPHYEFAVCMIPEVPAPPFAAPRQGMPDRLQMSSTLGKRLDPRSLSNTLSISRVFAFVPEDRWDKVSRATLSGRLRQAIDSARTHLHVALLSAVLMAIVVIFGAVTIDSYRAVRRDLASAAASVASAVAYDVDRNIELLDLSLQGVTQSWINPAVQALDPRLRNFVLFDHSATAQGIGPIVVLDPNGVVQASSDSSVPEHASFADGEYFAVHVWNSEVGLYVSKPLLSRIDGHWQIALSRRIKQGRRQPGRGGRNLAAPRLSQQAVPGSQSGGRRQHHFVSHGRADGHPRALRRERRPSEPRRQPQLQLHAGGQIRLFRRSVADRRRQPHHLLPSRRQPSLDPGTSKLRPTPPMPNGGARPRSLDASWSSSASVRWRSSFC